MTDRCRCHTINSDWYACLVIQHVVAVIRAILPTVVEMVVCSFIQIEFDTRVSKATNCSVDHTVYVRLTVNGPALSRSADVSSSILFNSAEGRKLVMAAGNFVLPL